MVILDISDANFYTAIPEVTLEDIRFKPDTLFSLVIDADESLKDPDTDCVPVHLLINTKNEEQRDEDNSVYIPLDQLFSMTALTGLYVNVAHLHQFIQEYDTAISTYINRRSSLTLVYNKEYNEVQINITAYNQELSAIVHPSAFKDYLLAVKDYTDHWTPTVPNNRAEDRIAQLQQEGKKGVEIATILHEENYSLKETSHALLAMDYVATLEDGGEDTILLHVSDSPMKAGLGALVASTEPRALPEMEWKKQ